MNAVQAAPEGRAPAGSHEEELLLRRILAHSTFGDRVRTLFQPIVNAANGTVVAYEALTRGPVGSALERPDRLFAAAERAGLTVELDQLCQAVALETAVATPALRGHLVFVNAEPVSFAWPQSSRLAAAQAAAAGKVQLVLEVSERRVMDSPAELLTALRKLRTAGIPVAVDDVGVNPQSLALLPLLEPDVVKLDMVFVQEQLTPERAAVLNAVMDYQERSGATLLFEGIETPEQCQLAQGYGAELAQGFLWARPTEPLVLAAVPPGTLRTIRTVDEPLARTPFDLIGSDRRVRTATKHMLLQISLDLEQQAGRLGDAPLLVACFQHSRHFGPSSRVRYLDLASAASFVAVVGESVDDSPLPGVRGGALHPNDPLCQEWNVVVLSPHFAGALLARDLGDRVRERDRRFDYAVTFDRAVVTGAARLMMGRVAGRNHAWIH